MKTNLIKTIFNKEKIFWKRNNEMRKKASLFVFIMALIFIVIGRICIVSMSFLFECIMWIFNREQFKMNLQKLNTIKTTIKPKINFTNDPNMGFYK